MFLNQNKFLFHSAIPFAKMYSSSCILEISQSDPETTFSHTISWLIFFPYGFGLGTFICVISVHSNRKESKTMKESQILFKRKKIDLKNAQNYSIYL